MNKSLDMGLWKKYKISEIGEVVGGATPSTNVEEYYGGDIPWLTPKDLSSFSGRYISRGGRNITEKGLNSCSARLLPAGSILFSSRAPIGYVAIAKNSISTNQGFKSIIPSEKVNNIFLFYLLKFNKEKIELMGSGTTFKEVSGATMKNIEVQLPSLEIQKKIADILSSLDDKIELNNKINDNLEKQAQAIFKSWFVDFEPFQDGEFIDSELGMIPKGWRVGTFRSLVKSTIGGDWGKDTNTGSYTEEVYCIRGADIPEVSKGNIGKMPVRFILPKNYKAKRLEATDLVVEISGGSPTQSTGRIAMISEFLLARYDKDLICTNFCRALKPNKGYSNFIYYYWNYLYKQNIMFSYENGTTGIKNLDINGLLDSELIVIPPDKEISKFQDSIIKFSAMIFNNGLSTEKLSNFRDSLLPKLMSGELSIEDI